MRHAIVLLPMILMGFLANAEDEVEQVTREHDTAIRAANDALVGKLKEIAKKAAGDGDLDLAAKALNELKRLEGKTEPPKTTPPTTKVVENSKPAIPKEAEVPIAQGKVVYKFWNDPKRLDFVGEGYMDKVEGENAFYKYGEMYCLLKITTPGEYKVRSQNYEGKVTVFFNGKQVNWANVTILPLAKGEYPLRVVFERPRTFDVSIAPKSEPSLKVLAAPYIATDPVAARELKADAKK